MDGCLNRSGVFGRWARIGWMDDWIDPGSSVVGLGSGGWMVDGRVDRWIDHWMDEWMDGRLDDSLVSGRMDA